MKNLVRIAIAALSILFIYALIMNSAALRAAPKATPAGKQIPAAVMKIAEKSCLNCHSDHGNLKARTKLNLKKWDSYTVEKQAAKAKAMCSEVTKGKMPPKKYKEKHPQDVPSAADVKTICEWAASLHVPAK